MTAEMMQQGSGPDDKVMHDDGSVVLPDGTVVLPDGMDNQGMTNGP
jgi:hypothetical protein